VRVATVMRSRLRSTTAEPACGSHAATDHVGESSTSPAVRRHQRNQAQRQDHVGYDDIRRKHYPKGTRGTMKANVARRDFATPVKRSSTSSRTARPGPTRSGSGGAKASPPIPEGVGRWIAAAARTGWN
jgi:hypothetical protein